MQQCSYPKLSILLSSQACVLPWIHSTGTANLPLVWYGANKHTAAISVVGVLLFRRKVSSARGGWGSPPAGLPELRSALPAD